MNDKLQIVCAGAARFGIFANDISTIVSWREPAPLPYAPQSVLGVVSIEGRMLTVLDLASLHLSEGDKKVAPRSPSGYIVGLRGDEQLALSVDSVGEKIELTDSDFESQGADDNAIVLSVCRRDGVETRILNLKELFSFAIQGHERRRRRF